MYEVVATHLNLGLFWSQKPESVSLLLLHPLDLLNDGLEFHMVEGLGHREHIWLTRNLDWERRKKLLYSYISYESISLCLLSWVSKPKKLHTMQLPPPAIGCRSSSLPCKQSERSGRSSRCHHPRPRLGMPAAGTGCHHHDPSPQPAPGIWNGKRGKIWSVETVTFGTPNSRSASAGASSKWIPPKYLFRNPKPPNCQYSSSQQTTCHVIKLFAKCLFADKSYMYVRTCVCVCAVMCIIGISSSVLATLFCSVLSGNNRIGSNINALLSAWQGRLILSTFSAKAQVH